MTRSPPQVPSIRGVAAASICGVLACAAWALWPLPTTSVQAPVIAADAAVPTLPARAPLNLAAFRAPLWVAPPPPPQAAAPPPPPPPLRLQLVAIVRDGAGFKAAVYDPDADKIAIVGPGDAVAGRLIERVRAVDLTLRDSGQSRTISLKTEGGTP